MDDWFHKIIVHRKVCIFHIRPTTHMIDKSFSFVIDVSYHRTTFFDIVLDTKFFFYLFSRRDSQFFVHKILCRDSMTIPSSFPLHTVTTHRHPSGDHIFYGRLEQMSIMRITTRKRRSIIKFESHICWPRSKRFFERITLTPKI